MHERLKSKNELSIRECYFKKVKKFHIFTQKAAFERYFYTFNHKLVEKYHLYIHFNSTKRSAMVISILIKFHANF